MAKFIYYLGAGASHPTLPLNNGIIDLVDDLRGWILQNIIDKKEYKIINKGFYLEEEEKEKDVLKLEEALKNLKNEISNHYSIDTYAKKLFIRDDLDDFFKVKLLLTILLIYRQQTRKAEKKYDSFWASMLKKKDSKFDVEPILPDEINIITWNYDYQLAKSFKEFYIFHKNSDSNVFRKLKINEPYVGKFSINQLNGNTILSVGNGSPVSSSFDLDTTFNEEKFELFLYFYFNSMDVKTQLSFAWENNFSGLIEKIIQCNQDAEVLISIGYSFPNFNRDIDRKIIRGLPRIRKVYIQIPESNSKEVIQTFKSIRNDIIPEPITQTNLFFIPPEL